MIFGGGEVGVSIEGLGCDFEDCYVGSGDEMAILKAKSRSALKCI